MATINELRDTFDDLTLSAEQIEALLLDIDLYALRDMLHRLHSEIRDVRRELLLLDADALLRVSRNFGGLH